ncbi:MAG: hypothetical protein KDD56_09410 [Bdellovibrionales bacterium]|nr:hypothetical protein [Bdellovibrionales bacterium]
MNPLPTPYDIVEFDHIPAPPDAISWLLLGFFLFSAIIFYRWMQKKLEAPNSEISSKKILIERLNQLNKDNAPEKFIEVLNETSLLVRSYLAFAYNIPFDTLSSTELKRISSLQENNKLKVILDELSAIDFLRYQQNSDYNQELYNSLNKIVENIMHLDVNEV